MRLNKFLAKIGLGSRREIDSRIEQGEIMVNEQVAALGHILKPGDLVNCFRQDYKFFGEEALNSQIIKLYIAFFKPPGVLSSTDSRQGMNIYDYIHENPNNFLGEQSRLDFLLENNLHHIGRLDKESRGLILITNDGDLTQELTHPKYEHEKEYLVTCKNDLAADFLHRLSKGVKIILDDDPRELATTLPCLTKAISANQFKIVLKQGYKRQIRKMVQVLGNEVTDLLRVRISNFVLKAYLDQDLIAKNYRENLIIIDKLNEGEFVEIQCLSI